MGGTFSRKQSEHRLRRDFVVTLLVTHKRLKNQKTYHDEGKDAMLNDMEKIERSWKFFDSQGTNLAAGHLKAGDLRSAEYSLLDVVARNPSNNEAKLLLAKVFMSQGMTYKAEKLHEEILTVEPTNVEALTSYGILLGKHVKEYELAEQILRLAVHQRPRDRSLIILHLHAQELAQYEGPRGVALDSEVETPPPKKIGEGRTPYGAMCEPPIDLPTAWSARPFQDFESHMRETYVEGYAKILEQEKEQENEGRFVEPDVRMQPKVAQRGKSNKLFCNYVDDNPTGLEAPTDVRRGNLVWPDEWYINKTVLTKQGTDPDMHLSKADVRKLGNIFQAAENKKQEADLKAVATRSSRVRESLKAMGKNFMTGGVAFKRGKEKEKTQDDRDQRRAAEDALKVQLELRKNEGGHKNLAQNLCTSGWLDKLNSKSDPKDPGAWRERLCFAADGAISYVSEKEAGKVNKVAEFKDIERAELASYPESSHAHSFILHFFDKSSITLAAKSFEERRKWMEHILGVLNEIYQESIRQLEEARLKKSKSIIVQRRGVKEEGPTSATSAASAKNHGEESVEEQAFKEDEAGFASRKAAKQAAAAAAANSVSAASPDAGP